MNLVFSIFLSTTLLLVFQTSQAFTLTSDLKHGWSGKTLKYNVNTSNCPAGILSALEDAADLWNSVATSYLQIEIGSTSSTTTPGALFGGTATDFPVIVCDTNFQATTGADQNAVAGAGFNNAISRRIAYGGVILNTSAGNASLNNMTSVQMAVVLAHEMGHSLGFGHSKDSAALMYYDATAKSELRLSADDWDALTYLYPRDELGGDDLMGCGIVSSDSSGTPWNILFLLLLPVFLTFVLRTRPAFMERF